MSKQFEVEFSKLKRDCSKAQMLPFKNQWKLLPLKITLKKSKTKIVSIKIILVRHSDIPKEKMNCFSSIQAVLHSYLLLQVIRRVMPSQFQQITAWGINQKKLMVWCDGSCLTHCAYCIVKPSSVVLWKVDSCYTVFLLFIHKTTRITNLH